MLSWLAVHAERPLIEVDLERRSAAALAAAGHGWASVAFDGREGLLVGHPADERQREQAVAVVRNIWGVRSVRTREAPTAMASSQPRITDVPLSPVAAAGPPATLDVVPAAAMGDLEASSRIPSQSVTESRPADATAASRGEVYAREVEAAAQPAHEIGAPTGATVRAREVAVGATHPSPLGDAAVSTLKLPVREPPAPDIAAGHEAGQPTPTPSPESKVAVAAPEARAVAPAPDRSQPQLPEHKGAPPPLPPSPPASPSAPAAAAAIVPAPSLPERKMGAAPQRSAAAPAASAPGQPTAPPRIDTAALPRGNIAVSATCVSEAEEAARRVEVHFARGDARLDVAGKGLIDGLIARLNACPDVALRIAGHADASGRARNNKTLSERRARSVAAYMIDKGIDAGRLIAVGYGDSRPVAPNDTSVNQARNRRIELAITGPPVPPMPVRKQGTRNGLSDR